MIDVFDTDGSQEDFDWLSEDCWLMALALFELTLWDVWVLVDAQDKPHHAYCNHETGYFLDWRCEDKALPDDEVYDGFTKDVVAHRPATEAEMDTWANQYDEVEWDIAVEEAESKFGESFLESCQRMR